MYDPRASTLDVHPPYYAATSDSDATKNPVAGLTLLENPWNPPWIEIIYFYAIPGFISDGRERCTLLRGAAYAADNRLLPMGFRSLPRMRIPRPKAPRSTIMISSAARMK